MKFIFMLLLFLTACSETKEYPIRESLTPVEEALVKTFTVDEVFYMEQCKHEKYALTKKDPLGYCLQNVVNNRKPSCPKGAGLEDIAVGTALGYGAVKLLFGK